MSQKTKQNLALRKFREVEYRFCGYLVKGKIPYRKIQPKNRGFAMSADEGRFFQYIKDHIGLPITTPHTIKIMDSPPMEIGRAHV